MAFAIISDIHSNLEALNRAMEYIKGRDDIDDIIILGDIVGYGANPNECIRLCRDISETIVLGHTHIPVIYGEKKQPEVIKGKYYLSDEEKHIINVGSIGQPRDRNPDMSFAVFNENEWS